MVRGIWSFWAVTAFSVAALGQEPPSAEERGFAERLSNLGSLALDSRFSQREFQCVIRWGITAEKPQGDFVSIVETSPSGAACLLLSPDGYPFLVAENDVFTTINPNDPSELIRVQGMKFGCAFNAGHQGLAFSDRPPHSLITLDFAELGQFLLDGGARLKTTPLNAIDELRTVNTVAVYRWSRERWHAAFPLESVTMESTDGGGGRVENISVGSAVRNQIAGFSKALELDDSYEIESVELKSIAELDHMSFDATLSQRLSGPRYRKASQKLLAALEEYWEVDQDLRGQIREALTNYGSLRENGDVDEASARLLAATQRLASLVFQRCTKRSGWVNGSYDRTHASRAIRTALGPDLHRDVLGSLVALSCDDNATTSLRWLALVQLSRFGMPRDPELWNQIDAIGANAAPNELAIARAVLRVTSHRADAQDIGLLRPVCSDARCHPAVNAHALTGLLLAEATDGLDAECRSILLKDFGEDETSKSLQNDAILSAVVSEEGRRVLLSTLEAPWRVHLSSAAAVDLLDGNITPTDALWPRYVSAVRAVAEAPDRPEVMRKRAAIAYDNAIELFGADAVKAALATQP